MPSYTIKPKVLCKINREKYNICCILSTSIYNITFFFFIFRNTLWLDRIFAAYIYKYIMRICIFSIAVRFLFGMGRWLIID